MERLIHNIFKSKQPSMVVLRSVLAALIVIMGLFRLRIILLLLATPSSYTQRDILQEYLLAKAVLAGVNPYLPLDELARMFIGNFPYLTHPAPYPPIIALLSIPLTVLNISGVIIFWFIIEMLCLLAISGMLTLLWNRRIHWIQAFLIFFLLLSWYPVMVDLLFGQLTLIMTVLVLAALLAIQRNRNILAGCLIGLSVAMKIFTWPLLIYFAIKKDWRALSASVATFFGLNLLSLIFVGLKPVITYYLNVTMQVSAIYQAFLKNYSLWSIGRRLFSGSQPVGEGFISAPPLIYRPELAPYVSIGLVVLFLGAGIILTMRTRQREIGYSIMICVLLAISPIAWDHYYELVAISVAVLLIALSRRSFPTWPTILSLIIILMLYLFNDQINTLMFALNGGMDVISARGNRISFASSLLECLPMFELVILAFLLWRIGITPQTETVAENSLIEGFADNN